MFPHNRRMITAIDSSSAVQYSNNLIDLVLVRQVDSYGETGHEIGERKLA